MAVTVESLVKNKGEISKKSSNLEKDIDAHLIKYFKIENPEEKIRYLLHGKRKKEYKNNLEAIDKIYQNAGWKVIYEIDPSIENYRTEELVFSVNNLALYKLMHRIINNK